MSRLFSKLTNGQLEVFREGLSEALLTQHARPDKRPYIHPIIAPDGIAEVTENQPGHHLWQHGLYVGLNDVNGVGFWSEGLKASTKATDGTFHPGALTVSNSQGDSVEWTVTTEWRSPGGDPMIQEIQQWQLSASRTDLVLTLSHTLHARIDLTFGEFAYGGLFLRMPFRQDNGGVVLNSGGAANQEAEAQRARWVAVEMIIPGREALAQPRCSIAVLDHPANPEHPVPWRVDKQLGVGPGRCIAGAWQLPANERATSKYRLLVRCGSIDKANIENQWQHFATE